MFFIDQVQVIEFLNCIKPPETQFQWSCCFSVMTELLTKCIVQARVLAFVMSYVSLKYRWVKTVLGKLSLSQLQNTASRHRFKHRNT